MIDIIFAFGEQITHHLGLRAQEKVLLFPSCGDTVRGLGCMPSFACMSLDIDIDIDIDIST